LPAEHAAYLTRASAADKYGGLLQYIAVMGSVEDEIVDCFFKGESPYERFPRFHAVMAEDSGQSVLSSLESHILPSSPGCPTGSLLGSACSTSGGGSGRIMNRLAGL